MESREEIIFRIVQGQPVGLTEEVRSLERLGAEGDNEVFKEELPGRGTVSAKVKRVPSLWSDVCGAMRKPI